MLILCRGISSVLSLWGGQSCPQPAFSLRSRLDSTLALNVRCGRRLMNVVAGLAAALFLSVQLIDAQQRQFLDRYCATCHNDQLKTGGLSLAQVDLSRPGAHPELWEKVARKLHTGVMPPANMPQPSEAEIG